MKNFIDIWFEKKFLGIWFVIFFFFNVKLFHSIFLHSNFKCLFREKKVGEKKSCLCFAFLRTRIVIIEPQWKKAMNVFRKKPFSIHANEDRIIYATRSFSRKPLAFANCLCFEFGYDHYLWPLPGSAYPW